MLTIAVASDLRVVGYNPEGADYDRPNGEVVGEVFYLVAENGRGERWTYGGFKSAEAAEGFILYAPSASTWEPARPAYGSLAYAQYGAADDRESERRFNEAEEWGLDTRFMLF